jgi:hypothetical protein
MEGEFALWMATLQSEKILFIALGTDVVVVGPWPIW